METNYAIVKGDTILNVIVIGDETPDGWLDEYIAQTEHDSYFDTSTINHAVSPGYVRKGQDWVQPRTLTSDVQSIAGDGVVTATLTYTDNTDAPPAEVDGTVNGQAATIPITNGTGTIGITSTNKGDTIAVAFADQSLQIQVV